MNKYLISIDFASKLGWSIWKLENQPKLIKIGKFDFQPSAFKKQFKTTGFQEKIFEKTIFESIEAKKLCDELFSFIPEKSQVHFLFEYSDFSFKYVIEHLSRLITMMFLEINNHKSYQISVSKIIAVSWRKHFKNNNPNFDFEKYIISQETAKKKYNWKLIAKDWSIQYVKNHNQEIDISQLNNSDITDSIIMGHTWIKYMKPEEPNENKNNQ